MAFVPHHEVGSAAQTVDNENKQNNYKRFNHFALDPKIPIMHFKRFSFKLSVWPVLLFIVMLWILVSLGQWQLRRADLKAVAFDAFQKGQQEDYQELDSLNEVQRKVPYIKVALSGKFSANLIFLDNQTVQGRIGVHVFSPFTTQSGEKILINRGWIAMNPMRNLPQVETPSGQVAIEGMLFRYPRPGLRLGELPTPPWPSPVLFPYMEHVGVEAGLGYRLMDRILLLSEQSEGGYLREWKPKLMPPEKHRAYAFQWFAMAAAVCGIFIAVSLQIKKSKQED